MNNRMMINNKIVLKEIIKRLFKNGTPLCQYINSQGKLMIEVSGSCPLFNLGKYRGVDLDIILKEVLDNE